MARNELIVSHFNAKPVRKSKDVKKDGGKFIVNVHWL